jgi:hypothetical protein
MSPNYVKEIYTSISLGDVDPRCRGWKPDEARVGLRCSRRTGSTLSKGRHPRHSPGIVGKPTTTTTGNQPKTPRMSRIGSRPHITSYGDGGRGVWRLGPDPGLAWVGGSFPCLARDARSPPPVWDRPGASEGLAH